MQCYNCSKEIQKRNKYCSVKCQKEYEYNVYIDKWKNGQESGNRGDYQISMHIKNIYIINMKISVQDVDGEKLINILEIFL